MEAAALAAAAEQLSALCGAAGDFGIPEPPAAGGWAGLEARVHAIALGQAPPPPAGSTANGGAAAAGTLPAYCVVTVQLHRMAMPSGSSL